MSNENLNKEQRLLALDMIDRAQLELGTDLDTELIAEALDVLQHNQDINSKAVRQSILNIFQG